MLAALLGTGCGIPVRPFTLTPVPRAGDGEHPVKAQVRRVAVTGDLLAAGARPDEDSRLGIEIDLHNADAQRPFEIGAPQMRTQAALGGPISLAGVVTISEHGLAPRVLPTSSAPGEVPPIWAVHLAPGQTRTFSVVYDRLSPAEAGGPLRILLTIPVVGQKPLELVLAAPVENGARWRDDSNPAVAVWNSSWTDLFGSGGSLLEPIGFGILRSKGRLVWGWNYRLGMLYRDTLASGPPAVTQTWGMNVGWHPWRFPVGAYASGGLLAGFETAPAAYRRANGGSNNLIFLPRLSAGVVLNFGPPVTAATLLPVERPRSALRRFAWRVGYARLFNTQDRHGTGALEVMVDLAIGP